MCILCASFVFPCENAHIASVVLRGLCASRFYIAHMKALIAIPTLLCSLTPVAGTAAVDCVVQRSGKRLDASRAVRTLAALRDAADDQDLPRSLVLRVAAVESDFKPQRRQAASSPAGVMQVICRWHPDKCRGRDLSQPEIGAEVGAWVLRECVDKHGGNYRRALVCYGGSNAYARRVLNTRLPRGVLE